MTANLHAQGFYRAAGFIDCGVADTVFSTAPRMALEIPDRSYLIRPLEMRGCRAGGVED